MALYRESRARAVKIDTFWRSYRQKGYFASHAPFAMQCPAWQCTSSPGKKLLPRLLGRCLLCKVRPNYTKVFREKLPRKIFFQHHIFQSKCSVNHMTVSCTAVWHHCVLSLCLVNRIFVTFVTEICRLFRPTGETINFTPKLVMSIAHSSEVYATRFSIANY